MEIPGIDSVLVANRGEIARRIIRTLRRLGIRSIAVYAAVDADLPYVKEADEAVLVEGDTPAAAYLNAEAIIEAAIRTHASAIHPGYGFLSENADFASRVADNGIIWIGPTGESMQLVADKINARNLMKAAGVPVAEGTDFTVTTVDEAVQLGTGIGFPVIVKPSGGGGGIGMMVARNEDELASAFETARSRAERFFGDSRILIERYIERARHVEIQILGLNDGSVIALGERDCSVQRRHQKVAEESPSPGLDDELRRRMLEGAVRAGEAVSYRNAGTVECLVDPDRNEYVFLEMNARLQVEHPVTEAVFGVDLVEAQLRIAAGLSPQFDAGDLHLRGHAIEFRVYAEDPVTFLPAPGKISEWVEPLAEGIRVDSGYAAGDTVTINFDPLLAKVIAYGEDRDSALAAARTAVESFRVSGPKTNLPFFTRLLDNEEYVSGRYSTSLVNEMKQQASSTR